MNTVATPKQAPRTEPRVVGKRARRIEDPSLLRGEGRYVDDIPSEGALEVAFVRSPLAHALITRLDTAAARACPGVVAVYTAEDIAPLLTHARMPFGFPTDSLPRNTTPWILARDEVAHVGELIAVVVAQTRALAEDAAALVEIDYEMLPVVADPRRAIEPDSPKVRRDLPSNILQQYHVAYGDPQGAFARAPHVFRERFWQHRGVPNSIECRGVLARPDLALGVTTVWSSTQMSHELFRVLAEAFALDENALRVIAPEVGGGFGGKFMTYNDEVATVAAALLLGRPVKWVEDRREHFVATIHERDQFWEMEIAVDADAHILGVRGHLIHDHGAYTPQATNVAYNSASSVTGPYKVPAYDLAVHVAYTNKTPVAPVRGAGYPQAAFVMERMMDRVAQGLGLDRAEVRARNLVPTASMPYTKPLKNRAGAAVTLDSGDYLRCQERALEAIDRAGFAARQAAALAEGRYIGLGLAHCVKPTGRGPYETAVVRVQPGGRVSIYTGALAMGQGLKTTLAMVCAEQLGVDIHAIDVIAGDTSVNSLGMGGFASRQTIMAGSAVHVASLEVKAKALKAAAHLLEAAEEDLELRDGRVQIAGVPAKGIALAEIARKLRGSPGYSMPGGVSPGLAADSLYQADIQCYANACHACEVEVDILTGDTRILRYVAVQDSGCLVNPATAEGQVHGGIVHGIGNVLYEWMRFDDEGQPITTTFADYLLTTATELPMIEVIFNESPSPLNPLGVKGIGEAATLPVAGALVSAIEDALTPFGVKVNQATLSPVVVLQLLREARARA
jgi:carbon-monoxide dehydrogenase large subunit